MTDELVEKVAMELEIVRVMRSHHADRFNAIITAQIGLDAWKAGQEDDSSHCIMFDQSMHQARAALTAIEAAGWAVVPIEPTHQMLADADTAIPRFEADENGHRMMGVDGAELCWNTMLSARPPIGGESK